MENLIKATPLSSSIPLITHNNHSSIINKLQSCNSLNQLKQIHSYIIKTSPHYHHQTHQFLYTKIISISSKPPSKHIPDITYIHSLFTKLDNPNIDLYNTVIRSLIHNNHNPLMALVFYKDLVGKGLIGDSFTYPYVLKACMLLGGLRVGEQVHSHVIKTGFVLNLYVVNVLMRFYSEIGVLEGAHKVFDKSPERDLVTWTVLIQGYVKMGFLKKGVEVFSEMCDAGVRADEMTMVVLISASARLKDLKLGKKLHDYIHDYNLNFDVYIGNALVDMYLKCGDASLALEIFDKIPVKNVVSWNSMILGLVDLEKFKPALNLFKKMQKQGVKLDEFTLVGVLNCCANLGTLKEAQWVPSYIDKNGIQADGFIGNALLDMYMKCGNLKKAYSIFNHMKHKDVYTYTTMIFGLAINGDAKKALEIFNEMRKMGMVPNNVTYVGILMACTHGGLVKQGCNYFMEMWKVHNIKPQKEHYGCMVDLLGRAGLLNEAEDFIQSMAMEPDGLVWGALLAACRVHGNVEIGERVIEKVEKIDEEKDGAYVLMSNIYSSLYRFGDAVKIRKTMKERKMKKIVGCSSIEVDGVVYEFRKGERSNVKGKEIYMLLDGMRKHLKNGGEIM